MESATVGVDLLKYCRHEEEKKKSPNGAREAEILYTVCGAANQSPSPPKSFSARQNFCVPEFFSGDVQAVVTHGLLHRVDFTMELFSLFRRFESC
jgi:hypothetical protein